MSDSVRPHRRQPIRLHRPWDSPGKSTGAGCHCLLQCMKVKSESEVAQSCPTFSDPMDCSLAGSSVHGIFQARVLEWGAIDLNLFPPLFLPPLSLPFTCLLKMFRGFQSCSFQTIPHTPLELYICNPKLKDAYSLEGKL